MPELPEVETVRKALLRKLKGKRIKDIEIYYNKIFECDISKVKKAVQNQMINDIKRKGKWLIFCLEDYYLLSHLRMEGKYVCKGFNDKHQKHELVIFNIDDDFELRYIDSRKFSKMVLVLKKDLNKSPISKLGPEPWDEKADIYLFDKISKKNVSIKTLLLDQEIISGIGNIYANEILFASGINPLKKGKDVTFDECQLIVNKARNILKEAIKLGGTTIKSYESSEGVKGGFQSYLKVHMKEGEFCPNCNEKIIKEKVNGRSTYYCKRCQK